jgi:uncharacterized protein YbjQ (UPF0145 family)
MLRRTDTRRSGERVVRGAGAWSRNGIERQSQGRIDSRLRDVSTAASGTYRQPLTRTTVASMPDQPAALPMTTALDLSGWTIGESLGVCYGLVVRSMGFTGGVAASFKGLRRGEIPEYTQLLEDSRRHAIDRMVDNARLLGADAVVAVRFDSSEIGQQFTEIVAYGTAVKAERVS